METTIFSRVYAHEHSAKKKFPDENVPCLRTFFPQIGALVGAARLRECHFFPA